MQARDPGGRKDGSDLTYDWMMSGEACGTPKVPWSQKGQSVTWSHAGSAPDSCAHTGTDHDVRATVTITGRRGLKVSCTIAGSEDLLIPFPLCLVVPETVTVPLNPLTPGIAVTANGAPTQTTIGANQAVRISYTNNAGTSLNLIVYAVVRNSLGQTVAYSTAQLDLGSGASGTAYPVLFGLGPGTYSVTLFATGPTGTALSATSTLTVTLP